MTRRLGLSQKTMEKYKREDFVLSLEDIDIFCNAYWLPATANPSQNLAEEDGQKEIHQAMHLGFYHWSWIKHTNSCEVDYLRRALSTTLWQSWKNVISTSQSNFLLFLLTTRRYCNIMYRKQQDLYSSFYSLDRVKTRAYKNTIVVL